MQNHKLFIIIIFQFLISSLLCTDTINLTVGLLSLVLSVALLIYTLKKP
jgi:hypothetical protein